MFFFNSLPCEIALLPDLYAKYGYNCASASSLSREYSISTGSAQNRESLRLPKKYFNSTRKETCYQLTALVKALHFCTCMSSISETTFQPQTIVVSIKYADVIYIENKIIATSIKKCIYVTYRSMIHENFMKCYSN